VDPLCRQLGIAAYRESETGRGPVDFEFRNGAHAAVQLEFKRTDSTKLIEGVRAQIVEYADARRVDSVLYVCVAFDSAGMRRFQAVVQEVEGVQSAYPDLFIRAELVDASRRSSASKLKAPSRRMRIHDSTPETPHRTCSSFEIF